jgi:multidrug efflux pump subunit AcrA (membrane-fusion protein)
MKLTLAAIAVFLVAGTATASAPGLTITLHGSGSVQPAGTVALGFTSQGRLTSVDVRVGQHVSRGQVLARIDASAARTALANALSTLASALARRPQLRVAVEQAQRALADTKAQIALEESTQQAAVDAAQRRLDERRAKRDADHAAQEAASSAYDAAKQKVADAQARQNGHQLGRADHAKQQTAHSNQLTRDQDAQASATVIANDKALLADDAMKLADYDRALTQDGIDLAAAQSSAGDAKAALDEAKQAVRDDDAALVSDATALETAKQTLAATKLKNRQTLHGAENAVETAKLAVPSTPDAIAAARAAGLPLVIAAKVREPCEREFFDEAIRPELGNGVEYAGEVGFEAKVRLLRGARALLFPIEWEEPFGIVMIEAMACGTPVVATRRGAVAEVVEGGHTGFVVDEPSELVAAVERIDEIDRAACRAHVEARFSAERLLSDYEAVYETVAEPASASILSAARSSAGSSKR